MNGMLIIPPKNHSFSENTVIWKASVQFGEKITLDMRFKHHSVNNVI